MARNITFEPCTLVYTLLNPKKLKFDDFSLIVRSLHSYQVESITPNPAMNNIHVKLNYQASINNAMNKLGSLRSIVGISKLSNYVNESEFSRLEQLRQKYGIAFSSDDCPQPTSFPRNQYKQRRGVFPSRPAPYQKKVKAIPEATATTSRFSTNVCDLYDAETVDLGEDLPDAQEFPGQQEIYYSEQLPEDNPGDQ